VLLIAGHWLDRDDFAGQFVTVAASPGNGTEMAVIDWPAAAAALGRSLPCSHGRARQHALHRVGCRGEVDGRDLTAPERLPLHPDRDLQEILPLQPPPVADQQLSGRLRRQPALRPRPDRLGEVIEARSKAGSPLCP
jgi:hypothetical protein